MVDIWGWNLLTSNRNQKFKIKRREKKLLSKLLNELNLIEFFTLHDPATNDSVCPPQKISKASLEFLCEKMLFKSDDIERKLLW